MNPETGQRLGPYEILGQLGGGGMARVFRAWDGRLHREVAIKLIHDHHAMPGIRERFLREARAASALNHPNICTVFDIGEQDGDPYLVMELLEGETLKERIAAGIVPVNEILVYASEIAEALGLAHSRSIVHRDVKPANIFLVNKPSGAKQAKVLDFGLAKVGLIEAEALGSGLTALGATVGTVSYMSPEQARGEALDARSDLFSLGIVIYEMATGQLPFQGATSALVFVQLLGQRPPESLRDWNASVPRDLERIVMKLLAKKPEARFQSAEELLTELEEVSAEWKAEALRKVKALPVAPRDPASRPKYPPRQDDAPRVKTVWEEGPTFKPVERALPAMPGDPQGVRPQRARKDPLDRRSGNTGAAMKESAGSAAVSDSSSQVEPRAGAGLGSRQGRSSVGGEMKDPDRGPKPDGANSGSEARASSHVGRESSLLARAEPSSHATNEAAPDALTFVAAKSSENSSSDTRRWYWIGSLVLILAVAASLLAWYKGWFRAAASLNGQVLLLTRIENPTGDSRLDVAILQGLEIDLMESRILKVRGPVVFEEGARLAGASGAISLKEIQHIAAGMGVTAYLTGKITSGNNGAAPYTVTVDVFQVATNRKVARVEETAVSKDRIAATIDRIAEQVRSSMGEPGDSITSSDVALNEEATANIDALYAYFQGQEAKATGSGADELRYFTRAVELEPKFVQAQMALARFYDNRLSELEAVRAAGAAMVGAESATDRLKLLAKFRAALDAEGDYSAGLQLIQQFEALYPNDAEGQKGMSEVLRLEGQFPEALQAAQAAISANPYDIDAYEEMELDLIGVDKYDGVAQVEAQMQRLGLPSGRESLLADYLAGGQAELSRDVALAEAKMDGRATSWHYATYMDNAGQLRSGGTVWQRGGTDGGQVAVSASTASTVAAEMLEPVNPAVGADSSRASFLAQGGLNRALTGECGTALVMVREAMSQPHGTEAVFDLGMAAALCGDIRTAAESLTMLERAPAENTAVREMYLPELKAAMAWKAGNAQEALTDLQVSRQFDLVSVGPYLRGLAQMAMDQPRLAEAEFQTILTHRGATLEGRSTLYPAAQVQLARALSMSGDVAGSSAAYYKLLQLWQSGDGANSLLKDARAHIR